jgi:chlorite dismutase
MSPTTPPAETSPVVPLTLEGSYVLHQMMRFRRTAFAAREASRRAEAVAEAQAALSRLEQEGSAAYAMLGHKGDLLLLHFRRTLDELHQAQTRVASLALAEFLEPASSYVSVVELGLYESTARIHAMLAARGLEPGSVEWQRGVEEELARQRKAMEVRLYPAVPPNRYLCFYPMDRKRGESRNWYREPFAGRARMMHEHGMVGRKYAGVVKQIISGSIGFDDWEWGVDLFSDDPLAFKKLIYEMRFDEVSAVYASFGTFFIGIRLAVAGLPQFCETRQPALAPDSC